MVIKDIVRYSFVLLYATKVLFLTLELWGIKKWARFWLSRDEDIVSIGGLNFKIRSQKFSLKLVDTYILLEAEFLGKYLPTRDFKIKENDTVVDIGAYIGSFSLFAAKHAKHGKVYSFEPFPNSYKTLLDNISMNKIKNVTAINKAVTDVNKNLKFYVHGTNFARHGMYTKSKNYLVVKGISLRNLFSSNNIGRCNLLKIDCEGGEYDVFFSTDQETFKKIDKIVCEYHEPAFIGITNPNYSPKKLAEHLEKNGFKVQIKKTNPYEGFIYARK